MSYNGYGVEPGEDEEQRTHINASDSDSGSRHDGSESFANYYQKLNQYNGTHPPTEADEGVWLHEEKLALFDSIAGQLQFTPHQKRRGRKVAGEIDFGLLGERAETALFALCCIVAGEDGRDHHPEFEEPTDDRFEAIQESLDIDERTAGRMIEEIANLIEENNL